MNLWIYLLVLWTTPWSLERLITGAENLENIAPGEGIMIERSGEAILANDDAMLSFVVKFKKPSDAVDSAQAEMRSAGCSLIGNLRLSSYFDNRINYLKSEEVKFLSSRGTVLQNYIMESPPRRQKRSPILALLGGLLVTGGMTAVTELQIAKINQHLKSNDANWRRAMTELESTKENVFKIGQQTLALVKNVQDTMTERTYFLECKLNVQDIIFRAEIALSKFMIQYDSLILGAMTGKKLTPGMLNPLELENILDKVDIFANTIFQKNPSAFYATAKIFLHSINPEFTTAHFVLVYPELTGNVDTFTTYHISQVGVFTPPSTCTFFQAPERVYWNSVKKMFEIMNANSCESFLNTTICKKANSNNTVSCLQPGKLECAAKHIFCDKNIEVIKFQVSLAGILLRNNIPQNTYIKRVNGTVDMPHMNKKYTTFIGWQNVHEIQIGNILLPNPAVPIKTITVSNFNENITVPRYNVKALASEFDTISKFYNQSLNELLRPVLDTQVQGYFTLEKIILLIILTIFGLWLTILTIILCVMGRVKQLWQKIWSKIKWPKFKRKFVPSVDSYSHSGDEDEEIRSDINTIRTIG